MNKLAAIIAALSIGAPAFAEADRSNRKSLLSLITECGYAQREWDYATERRFYQDINACFSLGFFDAEISSRTTSFKGKTSSQTYEGSTERFCGKMRFGLGELFKFGIGYAQHSDLDPLNEFDRAGEKGHEAMFELQFGIGPFIFKAEKKALFYDIDEIELELPNSSFPFPFNLLIPKLKNVKSMTAMRYESYFYFSNDWIRARYDDYEDGFGTIQTKRAELTWFHKIGKYVGIKIGAGFKCEHRKKKRKDGYLISGAVKFNLGKNLFFELFGMFEQAWIKEQSFGAAVALSF